MKLLAEALVIAGILVLVASLAPVKAVIDQLPSGKIRQRWFALAALICSFIVGYVAYAIVFALQPTEPDGMSLIVPAVFFCGACFVILTARLSIQTAIGLRRVSLLEQQTITDPLTGLYNRRYLDRRLEEELSRARRYGAPLTVLMVDIDHFKRVNDEHGHPAGDLALSYLGKLLLQIVRQSDIAARYGGEEFMVIAPQTPMATAAVLAERIRQQVESHKLIITSQHGERSEIRLTVSIGVAGASQATTTVEELVADADAALYQAKQSGRNRVVSG
ncbi:MAG: GGDEF domain-containing protein [Nevskiales bacterium]|nr:GGDEF domain-containing protein [Nevskiales bacterium]